MSLQSMSRYVFDGRPYIGGAGQRAVGNVSCAATSGAVAAGRSWTGHQQAVPVTRTTFVVLLPSLRALLHAERIHTSP
jgi:hypothetical protein